MSVIIASTQIVAGGAKAYEGIKRITDARTIKKQAETIAQAGKWGLIGPVILAAALAGGFLIGQFITNEIQKIGGKTEE